MEAHYDALFVWVLAGLLFGEVVLATSRKLDTPNPLPAWLTYLLALVVWPLVLMGMVVVVRREARDKERRRGPWD